MKRVLVWGIVLVVAAGAGFAFAALTYEPPDPRFEPGSPVPVSGSPAGP